MFRLLLPLVLLVYFPLIYADDSKLKVSTYIGLYEPALEDLNEHEFNSPIAGTADIIVGAGDNVQEDFVFNNTLSELDPGAVVGLEFLWPINNEYEFIVGASTWESTSYSTRPGSFHLQGEPADFINERSGKISFNEFYFGFKYNLIHSSKKFNAYYRLTLNELFDIDYREDLSFFITSGDAADVTKSVILQSQSTGVLMLQPGFGMDYFFSDWFSVGLDASYVLGARRATLIDGSSTTDFLSTDNISLLLPQRIDPDSGNLQYLSQTPQSEDDYTTMKLNFDGWKLLLRLNISF